jgi:hypothetical protein
MSTGFIIESFPPSDWSTVGQRMREARASAGVDAATAAAWLNVDADELRASEEGDMQLGVYELTFFAERLGTTFGAWLCGDERPLFRGEDRAASEAAAAIGQDLMSEFLRVAALAR